MSGVAAVKPSANIITHRERICRWLPFGWVRRIFREGGKLEYMNRYSLRAVGPSGTNPWRVYLHNFLAPDDANLHNHPSAWSFSVILWGSYTEEVLTKDCRIRHLYDACEGCSPELTVFRVVRRRVRWWNWIPSDRYHRITTLHPGPGVRGVWTLFMCGPLTGLGWGFWIDGRHVPAEE